MVKEPLSGVGFFPCQLTGRAGDASTTGRTGTFDPGTKASAGVESPPALAILLDRSATDVIGAGWNGNECCYRDQGRCANRELHHSIYPLWVV